MSGIGKLFEETRSNLSELSAAVELKPAQRDDIDLSIVIPVYNEQMRLPRTVLETLRFCTTEKINFELIVTDDGSRDDTLALVRLFEESDSRVRAMACPHMGKGSAVRLGMLNARGKYVLFMDADGATPLEEIRKLTAALDAGYDVAVGSRAMHHPQGVAVKTSIHRRIIGRIFAKFVSLLAVDGIADTQCGFKMFRRQAASLIFASQKLVGFAFDVEVLYIAKRLSFSVIEIPVNWTAQSGSKVNLFTDSIRMFRDISLIRWRHRNFHGVPSQKVARELGNS